MICGLFLFRLRRRSATGQPHGCRAVHPPLPHRTWLSEHSMQHGDEKATDQPQLYRARWECHLIKVQSPRLGLVIQHIASSIGSTFIQWPEHIISL